MDIVDGLRLVAGAPTDRLDCFNCHSRMREAADEITRLRAELEASETELRIVRASQAESNAEVERLRAELDSMTASRKAAAASGELWRAYQALKQAVIDAGMASNPMRAVAANMCPFCRSMIGAPHELWCRYSALAAKGEE